MGFNICYDGEGKNIYKTGSSPIDGCLYFSDNDVTEYNRVFSLVNTIRNDFLKVENGVVVEISQAEQDVILQQEEDAEYQRQRDSVGALEITIKDAFTAWLQLYNSKVPAQYQVTPLELKNQVKGDLGL